MYSKTTQLTIFTSSLDAASGDFTPSGGVASLTQSVAGTSLLATQCGLSITPGVKDVIAGINCGLAAAEISDSCFGFDVFGGAAKLLIPILSRDPNDKFGAAGVGAARYLSGEEPLRYSINFENLESATAAAQDVVVTDQLDASKLDFDTFSLGPISFGKDRLIVPPPGLSEFKKDVDLRPSNNLIVRVEAKLEKATGLLTWRFTSLDPATGLPTEDPTAGFLPPNKAAPEGEGQVLFTVRTKEGVATGTEIRNKARIFFDTNAPIDTPEWLNTIDYSKPSSAVRPLAGQQDSSRFEVSWSGEDSGSGVESYTVFVSEDGGHFAVWLRDTAASSAPFEGRPGRAYAFYSVARDAAGNYEEPPAAADALTATRALVLQLSAPGYVVGEGDGHAVITVTRTGNKDAASVAYATADGTASGKSDYMMALGTLRFAAGESSKSFSVHVTDDVFVEGSETINVMLSDPTGGATLGAPGTATLTISDNDTTPSTGNPVDDSHFFVRQHYRDFLNRDPDADGFAFWTNEIEQCGADLQCREVRRLNVSAAFFLSIEFQETGYFAYRMYKAAYGDATSPNVQGVVPVVRLSEFLADARQIGDGVKVNVGNWQQQLEENKNTYALEFVRRPRFRSGFPDTLTAGEFVSRLDENAGGVLSENEKAQLIATLGTTPSDAQKRASALRKVAEDAELQRAQFSPAFVLMQYYGYLRRNPDDPQDTDFRGWKFWLDKLEQFGGDWRRAEMVKAFLSSIEYRQRFGP